MYKTTTMVDGQQVLQQRDKNLAKTIGVVDGGNGYSLAIATLLNASMDKVYTVSDALKGLAGCLQTTAATSDNLQTLVRDANKKITDLEEAVAELQKQVNPQSIE